MYVESYSTPICYAGLKAFADARPPRVYCRPSACSSPRSARGTASLFARCRRGSGPWTAVVASRQWPKRCLTVHGPGLRQHLHRSAS